jgi:hypothetical protein
MLMTDDEVRALVGNPLRSRAMIAYALCVIAEEQIHARQQVRASETIRSVREIIAGISKQIDEDTSRIPLGDVREAQELLCGVDERIVAIEALVIPCTVH